MNFIHIYFLICYFLDYSKLAEKIKKKLPTAGSKYLRPLLDVRSKKPSPIDQADLPTCPECSRPLGKCHPDCTGVENVLCSLTIDIVHEPKPEQLPFDSDEFWELEDTLKVQELIKKSWYDSMRKFHKTVVECLEFLFDEDQYAKLLEGEEAQAYIFPEYPGNKAVFFPQQLLTAEGFIAEGKTSFMRMNCEKDELNIDGEFDALFRLPLKDGSRVPDKYISIFSLFGITSAIFNFISKETEGSLRLNRSYGSLALFGAFSGEYLINAEDEWGGFYKHMAFWFTADRCITTRFFQWDNALSSPLPWKESRNIEKELYPTISDYKFISSIFYAGLDMIFSNWGVKFNLSGVVDIIENTDLLAKLKCGDSHDGREGFFKSRDAQQSCRQTYLWLTAIQEEQQRRKDKKSFRVRNLECGYFVDFQLLFQIRKAKLAQDQLVGDFSPVYMVDALESVAKKLRKSNEDVKE